MHSCLLGQTYWKVVWHVSIHLFMCLHICCYVCWYIHMAVHPSVCALGHLGVHLSVCQTSRCLYSYLLIGLAVVCGLRIFWLSYCLLMPEGCSTLGNLLCLSLYVTTFLCSMSLCPGSLAMTIPLGSVFQCFFCHYFCYNGPPTASAQ